MTDYPERPEADFTSPHGYTVPMELGDDLYPLAIALTQCKYCLATIPQSLCLIVEKHTDNLPFEEHFCNESCANDFYLERLREGGL